MKRKADGKRCLDMESRKNHANKKGTPFRKKMIMLK